MGTLVIAPNWVGDTVMALPVLERLAASGRRVTVLAKAPLAPLLELVPAVSKVIERGGSDGETVAALRREGFAQAVLLPNAFRAAWLAWRAGIPRRWGYTGDLRGLLLRPRVKRPPRKRHQVEDYIELLEAMGVQAGGDWTPRLELTEKRRATGAELLERAGLPVGKEHGPLVGFFPGAEFGPAKRWPRERFAETIRELRKRVPRVRPLILAGPKEVWLAVRIYEQTAKHPPVVGPDLDLADLAAVLSHLDLLVTNDSGPMHLAAAAGAPSVALFGPTDPARTRPVGQEHATLYADRWCSPCFRRRCPLLHHRCMKDLTVEQVCAAAVRKLDEQGPE